MSVPKYPCQFGGSWECPLLSTHVARDNAALYAHVCENHYAGLPAIEQKNYARVAFGFKLRGKE